MIICRSHYIKRWFQPERKLWISQNRILNVQNSERYLGNLFSFFWITVILFLDIHKSQGILDRLNSYCGYP